MKKTMLLTLMWLGLSSASYGQEATQGSEKPSAELVQSLIESCKVYAQEDEVSAQELEKYLLACVNDELAMDDYQLPPSANKH